ncbi:MAG TPA: HDOD domain-containing protein [Terriglobales bacterium]|nr:HDOD domain-containing protein [Terriglobales bacterium]
MSEVKDNSAAAKPAPMRRFVARQPILTGDEKTFGYELLFRDGVEDYFCNGDSEAASRSTLDTSLLMGLDVLSDGRRAFINCTRDVLMKDYITLLPPEQAGVEILESVPADDVVTAACERLKQAGYLIALDDFAVNDPRESLVGLADIIKVDMRTTSPVDATAMVKRFRSRNCQLLAEKVETRDEFLAAKKAGFAYFQGYFFRRPELMQAREIPANRANYLRLLQAISRPELEPREIEGVIKGEASLCYRLLRYLNSPVFGFSAEVKSIRHALAMLGEREVRRWLRLVVTLSATQNKPSDLVLSALVRARFGELLAPKIRHGESDLFLVGLLSLMDAILEVRMGVVLEGISLDKEARAVLLGKESMLSGFYRLMLAQEAGDWQTITRTNAELQLPDSFVAQSHWNAMQWAHEMAGGV